MIRMRLVAALASLFVSSLAPRALAQRVPEPPLVERPAGNTTATPLPAADRNSNIAATSVMTAGYAIGGMAAGLWVADRFSCTNASYQAFSSCDRWKGPAGALLGGAALGALGAHVGNRSGGKVVATLAGTLGASAALFVVARGADDPGLLIPGAAIPFITAVATAHLTTGPRAPLPPRDVVRSLPEWQVRQESRRRYSAAYAVGGMLLGGAAGALIGGHVGYRISYARDIQHGCEDCGLTGAILGLFIGGGAGAVAGGTIGATYGRRIDQAEAAARILDRRGEEL